MSNTTTTALALAYALQVVSDRHAKACTASANAHALPKGTRGKAKAVTTADAERAEAWDAYQSVRNKIREANAPKVKAWVAGHWAGIFDEILVQIFAAAESHTRSHFALRTELGNVYASVSTDSHGLPQYIEIRKLADREERTAQGHDWLKRFSTTPEGKAHAEAIIADPDAHPYYSGRTSTGSITVGQISTWASREETDKPLGYSLNASTWQAETEEDADEAVRLVQIANLIRSKLNALALPTASTISAQYDVIG
jgi:hypothetical protein